MVVFDTSDGFPQKNNKKYLQRNVQASIRKTPLLPHTDFTARAGGGFKRNRTSFTRLAGKFSENDFRKPGNEKGSGKFQRFVLGGVTTRKTFAFENHKPVFKNFDSPIVFAKNPL